MNFERIERIGTINGYSNLICIRDNEMSSECQIRSRSDFSIIKALDLGAQKFAIKYFEHKVVLSNLKENHIEILVNECAFKNYVDNKFIVEQANDFILWYYPIEKEYVSEFCKKESFKFIKDGKKELKFHNTFIIELYMNEKTNNWVRCIDAIEGKDKWKLEYQWEIVRCEQFENILILDYHAYENLREDDGYKGQIYWSNPNKYAIAIDCNTGQEIWKKQISYSKIDKIYGVLLAGDNDVIVVDLRSGITKTKVEVTPKEEMGYYPHFVNADGIYYTTHNGAFGRIKKDSGIIDWEFYLIDTYGEKRKLSDWILLGNGKLVLQAMPNHPNGDLICIFDPIENLDYSNVKDGIRVN